MTNPPSSQLARAVALTAGFAAMLLFSTAASALSSPTPLDSLADREREVLDAIAARDADVRDAALLATLYPDTLVHVELIQARSSAAFEHRVKTLDREHQEEIWELVRADGAMRDIVEGGRKSEKQLGRIASRYPERIRPIFTHLGSEHFETLEEAHAIKVAAEAEFETELESLPDVPRNAFRQLLGDPSLLAMLGRSPSAVAKIGDAFDADPDATLALVDELAVEVEQENAKSETNWRESFDNDPNARAELESAARRYADEYGYDYDELTNREVEVNVHVYQHPYPYWFGYPHWYAHWDPWGVWYPVRPHFGFYYGHRGRGLSTAIFFGFPSLHFVNWYYAGHYGHYPYLSRHINHHHSRYAHAYRPLHRRARLHHYGHRQHDRRWAPQRLSPRAVHAAEFRAERRERGIERRETRREHMAARRAVQRENGIERRDGRRERMGDRRDERRERAADRKTERRDKAGQRLELRRERADDRRGSRDIRADSGLARAESAMDARRSSRSSVDTRDRASIQERLETRREARRGVRADRVGERKQAATVRRVESRTNAESRLQARREARVAKAPLLSRREERATSSRSPRIQSRTQQRAEPRVQPRTQQRAEPRVQSRTQQRAEPRVQPRTQPQARSRTQLRGLERQRTQRAARAEAPPPRRSEPGPSARSQSSRSSRESVARSERSRSESRRGGRVGGMREGRRGQRR